jgi:BASS family bile acid:Na+ symporter
VAGGALFIVAILMLGLGLSLAVEDFRRVGQYPWTIVAALVCQMLLLPLVCFVLVTVLRLAPVSAMGMMLIAAAPGGPMAGVYSHVFGGDVAFNLTLTAINSALSVVTLPLLTAVSLAHFLGTHDGIGLQIGEVLKVMAAVFVPVALGMLIRAVASGFAARAEPIVRILAGVVLVGFIVSGLWRYHSTLTRTIVTVLPAVLLFSVASLTTGYLAGRLTRANRRVSIAACMEIGFHNAGIAISVAMGLLHSFPMAIPASLYGLSIMVVALAAGLAVSRGARRATEASVHS